MKKLFLLLFAAAAFAACDDDKDYGTANEEYSGTLTVTLLSDPSQVYTFDDKRFSLVSADDGTLTDAEPSDRLTLSFECMGFRVAYAGTETD